MTYSRRHRGFSLVEILVAIAIFGILAAAALPHVDGRRQNINSAVSTIIGGIRLARAKAMSTGIHYCMHRTSTTKFYVRRWSDNMNIIDASLPAKVTWTLQNYPDLSHLMFNSRGMAIDNTAQNAVLANPVEAYVSDTFGITHKIVIWPSGQVYQEY